MDNNKKIIKKSLKAYLKAKEEFENANYKKSESYLIYLLDNFQKMNVETDKNYQNIINSTIIESKKLLDEIKLINFNDSIEYSEEYYKDNNIIHLVNYGDYISLKKLLNNNQLLDLTIYDEEGLTPLHLAIKNGDLKILNLLLKYEGNVNLLTNYGFTLFEYACLQKDPVTINYLQDHGANMDKHLELRNDFILEITHDDLDDIIILKKILAFDKKTHFNHIPENIYNSTKTELSSGIKKYTIKDILLHLETLLDKLPETKRINYLKILQEDFNDFNDECIKKIICPKNIISLICYNLAPFVNYNYSYSSNWLINLEISFTLKKILKDNIPNKINIKKKLINKLYKDYINNKLYKADYIGILITKWVNKI